MESLFSEEEIKNEIIRVSKVLYERQLITALGGSISARIPGAAEFWITPRRAFRGALKSSDLVKVNLNCERVEGNKEESIETPLHAALYRARPDVNAIIRSYNPWVLGLYRANKLIKTTITDEAALVLRKVGVIKFDFAKLSCLAEKAAKVASTGVRVLVVKDYGVIGLGTNVLEAETLVELMEDLAIVEFICYGTGKEPPELPPEDIETVKTYWGI